tara:strand:+ start:13281 stop:15107 length:1827 start_codon:yes stop_codon:yes gene_type:complete
MQATIEDLRDSFKIGYEAFEASRKESNDIWDLYHNRHYTQDQLAVLERRGQPAETFNVVKLFARMLVGYYSTIVNTVVASPINPRDVDNATLLNDTIANVFEDNRFDILGDQIKLAGLVSGVLVCEVTVEDTGVRDAFGRPVNRVNYESVDDAQVVFDPSSTQDDYSDAAFLHRFKWLTEDNVIRTYGKAAMDKLTAYHNFLDIDEADFDFNYGYEYTGYYRVFNNYLIVHTVMEDTEGKRWSCHWSGTVMLSKKEITLQDCRWPYRVQFLHSSNVTEYYGIFREIAESQRAINQALIKLQLMVNSEKAFVEEGAVDNIDDFTTNFNRVNAVIEVKELAGIKIEQLSREILDQYTVIDKALDRIQRVLGVNDSFLGMAYASDSGRKVKLQQSATIMSLRYITARIESFYRSLGEDTAKLIRQYYTANQVLMVADEVVGQRWVELNKPMTEFVQGPNGPMEQPILLPETDPANDEILEDEEGNIIMAPVNEFETELKYMDFVIRIDAAAYNDEDEKAQLMLETVMSGQVGQMMSQVNPAGFFKMSALAMKSMKTKYSPEIVRVLNETAQMLGGDPQAQAEAQQMAQGSGGGQQPQSKALKLPQNTNEGV